MDGLRDEGLRSGERGIQLDRKSWFIDFAKTVGRKNLKKYFIGVIRSILCNHDNSEEEATLEICNAAECLGLALNDESLPWDVADIRKASTPTEAEKENTST